MPRGRSPRIVMTIRELACRLDLSKSAVSMALKNDPHLSMETRILVNRMADQFGYRPDPTVAKVMSSIARHNEAAGTAPLILLSDWPTARFYQDPSHHLDRYYKGICQRAAALGYRVEEVWMRAPNMNPARVQQILEARAIQGVIIFNYQSAPAALSIDVSPYASVVIGRALVKPRTFAVDHDHHQGLVECLRQIKRAGYDRPGLVLTEDAHERTMHCWAAAYQFHRSQKPARMRIPLLIAPPGNPRALRAWLKSNRPDVIVTHDESMLRDVEESGFSVPGDFGMAVLFWRNEKYRCAGIDTRDEALGGRAVELVVEQIRNNQKGLPCDPETVLFDGIWRDGPSLPRDEPAFEPVTSEPETEATQQICEMAE
jgi:LacI family transcriptional regulator